MVVALLAALIIAAGASIGSYALYHKDKNIWLLTDIGRITSKIVFPGESDLRDLTDTLSTATVDLTIQQPCNLCSGNPDLKPAPLPTSWPGAQPNTTCSIHDKPGLIQLPTPTNVRKGAYWHTNCENTRPNPNEGSSLVLTDCVPIAGMNGFTRGLSPSQYILKRLFNVKGIKNDMKYNQQLFTNGSPYQSQRSTQSRHITGTGRDPTFDVDFSCDAYYRMNYGSFNALHTDKPRVFLPPMLNRTGNWFTSVKGNQIYYWDPKQMSGAIRNLDGTLSIGTGHYDLVDKLLAFPGCVVIQRGFNQYGQPNLYMSLEWAPSSLTDDAPPPIFADWGDAICQDYISKFMECNSYSINAYLRHVFDTGKAKIKW